MKDSTESGFTLIELVVSVLVMAMMVGAVGSLFVSNLNTVVLGKARAVGLGLANYQMEYLRDLPYNSLATAHGTIYPPGNIPDSQTEYSDGYKFTVKTIINYVHDPYDKSALYPFDYKQAEVEVILATSGQTVAELATSIAPKATQTPTNTGILSISVINASGQPVPNASVTIVNNKPSPAVNISTTTNNQGVVVIPDLPPESNNSYQVTATASGYSTDETLPPPGGSQTAVEPNPNILDQQITSITLSIDLLSTLNVTVNNTSGSPINNLAVTITGSKEIYKNPIVYKYSKVSTTSSGTISLPNMEWDSYSFAVPSGYEIVSSSPAAPVALSPNSTQSVTLVVSNSTSWPAISSYTPSSQETGSTGVSLAITGSNLPSTSTVNLEMSGQSNITATGCTSSGSNPSMVLTCSLNLTGAATGNWDIDVSNSVGTADQTGGFDVTP
jgi:type II secretory pathway pseudopilin PulG